MKSECLDFRSLPGQNSLFLSYLYDFEKISRFYSNWPLTPHTMTERIETAARLKRFPRSRLMPSLTDWNRKLGAGKRVFDNLKRLESADCLAVVTGQQVGLFGGPSYAVYKAASAIRLTQLLQEKGVAAVPVFWLAADDSDFQEIRSSTFFSARETGLEEVRYPGSPDRVEQMVGTVELAAVESCLQELEKHLGKNEFSSRILSMLYESYSPASSFRAAFAGWMSTLFQEWGLIVFDPLHPGHRQDLGDFFSIAVENRQALLDKLLQRNQELRKAGFEPQVHVEASETLLFWIEGKNRFKLEYQNGRYKAKGRKSVQFTEAELLECVARNPGAFGSNVLLRPILQDYLFPTALYVGGPAETAYFAQVSPLAPFWGLESTIFPRASFTIVDRKCQRYLRKYHLSVKEIVSGDSHHWTEKILRDSSAGEILKDFDKVEDTLRMKLAELKGRFREEDRTVAEMLGNAEGKVFYQLEKVKNRFVENYRTRSKYLQKHLNYLQSHLKPGGHLQERTVNFNQFLSQEGPQLVSSLIEHLYPFCFSHRVWYL